MRDSIGEMADPLPRAALAALVCLCAPALARQSFQEVGASRGLVGYRMAPGMTGGLALVDFDQDGFLDVFAPTAAGMPHRLYRGHGDGTFSEVAAALGLDGVESARGALWFDAEDDGDLDLLLIGDAFQDDSPPGGTSLRLYRQETDGTFSDVTRAAGLWRDLSVFDDTHAGGVAAGDLDRDGDLDLWIAYWEGPTRVLLNNGAGHFSDVTAEAGVDTLATAWQPSFVDWNGDGWVDVYQAIDFGPNRLWLNRRDGTFVDVAPAAGADNSMNDMGVAVGDYDRDGDFDLYVTNLFTGPKHNVLLRNDSAGGALAFVDVSVAVGVADGACGWGTTFLDGANAGRLDIAATNGGGGPCLGEPSRYFASSGGASPAFREVGAAVGYDGVHAGGGLVAGDVGRDGDLDLLEVTGMDGPLLFYEATAAQTGSSGSFLLVRPRQAGRNRFAAGALVRVQAGGALYLRRISAGTSILSQEPYEAHFGLGDAVSARVDVEWPDRSVSRLEGVALDRVLDVRRPALERRCEQGAAGIVGLAGTVSIAANDCALTIAHGRAGSVATFVLATDRARIPFGNGTLCVGGRRAVVGNVVVGGDGVALCSVSLGGSGLAGIVVPGARVHAQAILRDPVVVGTPATSDAIAFVPLP